MKRKGLIALSGCLFIALISATTLSVSAWAKDSSSKPSGPIVLGLLIAQTGPFASYGPELINGFKLAIKEAGYQVAGRRIKIVVADEGDGTDPSFAVDKARKMVEHDGVQMIVGPLNGNNGVPVWTYASQKKISTWAGIIDSSSGWKFPYHYNTIGNAESQPVPLGWFAAQKGTKTVTAIADIFDAGKDFSGGFAKGFQEKGGKFIQLQYVPMGTADFSSYIVNMKPADAIMTILLPPDFLPFVKQADQVGLWKTHKLYITGSTLVDPMLPALGPILAGKAWNVPEFSRYLDDPSTRHFNREWLAKYPKIPPSNWSAEGYAKGQIILKVLEITNGDISADAFHEALVNLKMDTCLGPLSWTKGNPDKTNVQGIHTGLIEKLVKKPDGTYGWKLVETYPDVQPFNWPKGYTGPHIDQP